jgi:hypothetical protein
MADNKALDEILVVVKALTKKIDEQQEQICVLVKSSQDQATVIANQYTLIREMRRDFKDFGKCLSELADGKSTPVDDTIMEKMEKTLKTYAEVAKQSHVELLEAKEEERRLANEESKNQEARAANCKLSGLEEKDEENTKEVLVAFLESQLKVHDPQIIQAFRVGKKKVEFARPIIVKFASAMEKARIIANRAMLKGQRIWLDDDLTPMQVQAKKVELEKVKVAKEQGFVAYMKNGKALITQTKATTSK